MNQLKILITGAAGGLGSALAVQLSRGGANLLLLDKNLRDLDALSDQICKRGQAMPGVCPLDFSTASPTEFNNLVDVLLQEYNGLDALIHCAATFQGLQTLDQISPNQWQECMQVNVNAAWQLTAACLPLLKESRQGRLVFVHEEGKIGGSAYWGAYGVSKAALRGLGYMFKEELEGSTIRVLNVEPGPMRTGLRAQAYLAENPDSIPPPSEAAEYIINKMYRSQFFGSDLTQE